MKTSAILIAAIAIGAVAPAFAAPQRDSQKTVMTYDAKRDKYCVSQLVTGSRLAQKECRTKQDWAKEGLQIQDVRGEKLASK
jgi:hypothetical protein